ncbi:mitochondrial matrix Mmp37-domain-containing protein [Suillus bovinus]|uniref:mitochondrial matrix Mmp37-domain-containing protein n=1 Tax=Suillus bovinus TaxID=48563 RepID=UPI001B86D15F|nr:mitochondrial matrix Mmp37-domain-containing protein [Suillus bovinus]KAG2155160.1 mitochondrial matrix Mmp37-domain-containing protein [Suillus bovinus]
MSSPAGDELLKSTHAVGRLAILVIFLISFVAVATLIDKEQTKPALRPGPMAIPLSIYRHQRTLIDLRPMYILGTFMHPSSATLSYTWPWMLLWQMRDGLFAHSLIPYLNPSHAELTFIAAGTPIGHPKAHSDNDDKEGETHFLCEMIWNIFGISNDITENGGDDQLLYPAPSIKTFNTSHTVLTSPLKARDKQASFGQNQVLPVRDSTRALLEDIVRDSEAPIRYAYGSGISEQAGYEKQKDKEDRPTLDFIFAVTHPDYWRSINMKQHPGHYPLHARVLGLSFVSKTQGLSPGLWFNTFVLMKGVNIKYGVTTVDMLCADLLN